MARRKTLNAVGSKHFFGPKVGAALFIIALAAVIGYFVWQRNTYRFSIHPGETIYRPIEVPMQRFWEHKSYAKEAHLPVTCVPAPSPQADDGIVVTVMDTGHKLHLMWANLRIVATPDATPGIRKRRFDFTIDGHGDWPRATVVVRVTGDPNNR